MNRNETVQRKTYTATEVAAYLGVSRSYAYKLLRSPDFPSFRVGGRVLVTREAMQDWVLEQQSKHAQVV